MRRVVITGTGVISSLGSDTQTFWNNIKTGKCGISHVEKLGDLEAYTCKVAAEIKDFDASLYMDKRDAKRMDLYTQYAVAGAKLAIEDSGIDFKAEDPNRVGVIIGSGMGGGGVFEDQCDTLKDRGPGRVSPFCIPMLISNIAAGQIAIYWNIKGTNYVVASACASGSHAIGEAFRNIKHGYSDVIVSGGAEAPIIPISFAGFCSMKAMSTNEDPMKASIPFDKNRDGFVMGEGAGIVVLEELEHAKARGANILAEVVGYGSSDDAFHMTAPAETGEGAARAMQLAIDEAGLELAGVDYINAHGTSTPYNDKFETLAIKNVFGDRAKDLLVSSTKSMTGHMLGAAGGIEAIVCALSLNEGFVPPTIGYTTPDEELDLNYVPNEGINKEIDTALSNSFGFGGHNACLCIKKYKD